MTKDIGPALPGLLIAFAIYAMARRSVIKELANKPAPKKPFGFVHFDTE